MGHGHFHSHSPHLFDPFYKLLIESFPFLGLRLHVYHLALYITVYRELILVSA